MASRLWRSPTVQTLVAFLVVFVVSYPLRFVLEPLYVLLFTLSAPVSLQPWTLVTSVYAHGNLGHLLANSIALVLIGIPVERATRGWAYHAFFVITGALAGLAHVYVAGLLGGPVAVVGASGAVFAMFGYALAGNRLTSGLLDTLEIPVWAQVGAFLVVAVVVTWAADAPGVATFAHFAGLAVGLAAGWVGVLPSRRRQPRPDRGRPQVDR